jgi:hypothetical protein
VPGSELLILKTGRKVLRRSAKIRGWVAYLFELFDGFVLLLDIVNCVFDFAMRRSPTQDQFIGKLGSSFGVFRQLVQLFFTGVRRIDL